MAGFMFQNMAYRATVYRTGAKTPADFEVKYTFIWVRTQKILWMSNQSCSVSKETIDLTVTRVTLWSNNLFKSANIIILRPTKTSLW